jgi:hypothetical protein
MPLNDLTGRKFGRLTVIERAANGSKGARWRCVCECGGEKIVASGNLHYGGVKSCGCWRRERGRENRTHGESGSGNTVKTKEYGAYRGAKNRCENPRDRDFKNWGGRGVKFLYPSYEAFLADLGRSPPGTSLDRIDNNGHYEPGNCRWATPKQQVNNQREKPREVVLASCRVAREARQRKR